MPYEPIEINRTPKIDSLYKDLSTLIEKSKQKVISQAKSTVNLLFWQIGKRINDGILNNKRAEYGKQIVPNLAGMLSAEYGRSFEEKNLRRMLQFAECFPEKKIVVPLARQLSWSHIIILLPLKSSEEKLFYAQRAIDESLGKRDLRALIEKKTFERTKIANTQISKKSKIPLDTFKDPYLLDFLGLQNAYLEKDIEEAILRDLENFILELGKGFAFVERQKRMIIDGDDFYLDLLFYHRKSKRLVAIELKIGKFQAKYQGQMKLYLKWLNRYERQSDENEPIGLILCAGDSREQIELLEMDKDGIMVAEYWTELPPKEKLEEKIRTLLLEARERIKARQLLDDK
ncbi:MAG: PDDEXK nuclease domain-containing protein [Treponema sp.]|nr:PDDEXK nuclease domain-containing protein [Treponema sp.]